jgi:hypothetical protein
VELHSLYIIERDRVANAHIDELPPLPNDDQLRWKIYYAIYGTEKNQP